MSGTRRWGLTMKSDISHEERQRQSSQVKSWLCLCTGYANSVHICEWRLQSGDQSWLRLSEWYSKQGQSGLGNQSHLTSPTDSDSDFRFRRILPPCWSVMRAAGMEPTDNDNPTSHDFWYCRTLYHARAVIPEAWTELNLSMTLTLTLTMTWTRQREVQRSAAQHTARTAPMN